MKTVADHFRPFSQENLLDIYNQKISTSETVGLDRVHPAALGKVINEQTLIIEKKVRSGTYQFTPFKEVLLPKGAGSPPRLVSLPTARDRIVLRALYEILLAAFPEAVSEIAQIKIASIVGSMTRYNFGEFIKVDVTQFYPSISHAQLLDKIKTRIREPEILALIERAITTATVPASRGGKGAPKNSKGVPQGLAISNVLAQLYMGDFDKQMCLNKAILYQRYVDDILVLCPTGEASNTYGKMYGALHDIGLTPHELNDVGSKSKSGLISSEFEFLGYRFADRLISVRKSSILKLESAFANIFTTYSHMLDSANTSLKIQRARDLCEFRLNLRITGCIHEGKRLGWVFYFSQITDISKLRGLDHTVDCLLKRFHLTGQIKVKRLLKSFYEAKRTDKTSHSYITDFDQMSVERKRQILSFLTGHYEKIKTCTDDEIVNLFKLKIHRVVQELQKNLVES